MSDIYLDTHTLIWLLSEPGKLSPNASAAIDHAGQTQAKIYISAITIVEIVYLVEKGRIPEEALELLLDAVDDPGAGLVVDSVDLDAAVAIRQIPRNDAPDMPDRLIAASALHHDIPLITRDEKVRKSPTQTIW
ncbi:type II toxin-antitoxin system VapC family toxin [Geoalkalibacter halelectricus]|uniref:Ribonuclease VapC n=1 Tax=Geoalkalibacter halelectricus TaxID=2847045 RepID=A0ABY5ZNZ0_9BACT|nr:type II toxin-antitoxin system VapC family toxin [Geoalkalibacter halelectricus]MDO3379762.1 type II toxin-antitoxin system VapC family toxin [Geoalkalibacter halelectricus]UWZ79585.1 type II toxin-antitoxin system VapC family toxin [Geoalkalibacter halelectricus]